MNHVFFALLTLHVAEVLAMVWATAESNFSRGRAARDFTIAFGLAAANGFTCLVVPALLALALPVLGFQWDSHFAQSRDCLDLILDAPVCGALAYAGFSLMDLRSPRVIDWAVIAALPLAVALAVAAAVDSQVLFNFKVIDTVANLWSSAFVALAVMWVGAQNRVPRTRITALLIMAAAIVGSGYWGSNPALASEYRFAYSLTGAACTWAALWALLRFLTTIPPRSNVALTSTFGVDVTRKP